MFSEQFTDRHEAATLAHAIVQKGRIKVVALSEQGKEAVVGILEPAQFFGEGCLNGHPLRMATTTAMEDTIITSITKAVMLAAAEVRIIMSASKTRDRAHIRRLGHQKRCRRRRAERLNDLEKDKT